MADSLGVGKIFSDDESVKSMVADYNKTYFTSFTISTNNKKSIVFKCKHGRKRKYDGKGKRPNQTYNFIGCSAQVNFYKNKDDGTIKITKSVLCHNHECSNCEPPSLNLPSQIGHMNIAASIGSLGDVRAPFISHLISDEPSYFDL